jgi:hypothetical protein
MPRYLLALCLSALAVEAWGQTVPRLVPEGRVQAPVPVAVGQPLPDGWVQVTLPPAVPAPAPAKEGEPTHYILVGAPGKHDKCQDKVCVPEPYTKKTPRVYHDVKEKEYCLPGCTPWEWLKNRLKGNYSCDQCQKCGKVRTRNVLIKKTAIDECPAYRCVVKPVAGCTDCGTVLVPVAVQPRPK